MEDSILKAASESTTAAEDGVGERVASAWRSVGLVGRASLLFAVLCSMVIAGLDAPASLATGLSLAVLTLAALVDVVEHRLPNVLVAVAAVPVLVALIAAGSADLAADAALGAALLGGPLLVTHVVSPTGMGFGDVKAGAVLGAALGLIDAQIALVALVVGLALSAGWAVMHRRRTIALGPGLVAGALAALLVTT